MVVAALAFLVAPTQLPAGVKVMSTAEPIETLVAFQVAAGRYIGTSPSNSLEIAVGKIGSKQRFTVIDLSGGNFQDGDEVQIRYTPHNGNPSYWLESTAGIRRGRDGDVFKLKRVDSEFALVTPTGKFVAPPVDRRGLGVSAKQDGALIVEIIDMRTGEPVIKPAEPPATGSATPPSKPENAESTPPPAPATDKSDGH